MLSATDFLPLFITMLMKRAISWLPCLGSGRTRRAGCEPLRDMFFVRCFRGHPCPHERQPSWPPHDFAESLSARNTGILAAYFRMTCFFGRLAPYFERD